MKQLPVIFFSLLLTLGFAFSAGGQDTINQVDANGLKQGHWIFYGSTKKLPGYAPDAKVEEGNFANGRKSGKWTSYFPAGTVKHIIEYNNGRPNGYYVSYYENGQIEEEGTWTNNKNTGSFKRYYPNGNLAQEFNFNPSGKREGIQKYYHENGKVMIEGNWQQGKESGVIKEYYENGDLKAEKNFAGGTLDVAGTRIYEPRKPLPKENKPKSTAPPVKVDKDDISLSGVFSGTGTAKLFNANRQISKDGYFSNYKLIDGKEYIYDNNGLLQRIAIYKDGVYVGDGVIEEK